ncbi:MAG: hypothetical protein ABIC95_06690 [archaeon]
MPTQITAVDAYILRCAAHAIVDYEYAHHNPLYLLTFGTALLFDTGGSINDASITPGVYIVSGSLPLHELESRAKDLEVQIKNLNDVRAQLEEKVFNQYL